MDRNVEELARHADAASDRRDFLKGAGKFALVAPPAMAFLLSTTMTSNAIANSTRGNNGCGNGVDPPPPGVGNDTNDTKGGGCPHLGN